MNELLTHAQTLTSANRPLTAAIVMPRATTREAHINVTATRASPGTDLSAKVLSVCLIG